ncbi:signal peptidase I [Alteromonas sp. ASW11-19]|uniref:Signal peptidase I n=1 Tax=Alteromonas salexigens TaxID=2982530 RepID=A0ABT2VSG8_9ALTE|nr:signal peptidase I [Alteromonas salexigens]MCU7555999.1 signal peptidase I [Alteromonas salexigens]
MKKAKLTAFWQANKQFILFVVLLFCFRSSFADWYDVPTGSMKPTIVEGDRVFVNKMAFRLDLPFTDIAVFKTGSPMAGDVIVFQSEAADTRLIKRVVGVPGDVVSMLNNQLTVNGKQVAYSHADDTLEEHLTGYGHRIQLTPPLSPRHSFAPVTVPQGHYLVLGDNRNHSADSRYYGFVPERELLGKATRVVFSLDPENYYLPRTERTLISMR